MPVVGVEPTRVISTRDFEFWGGFSIWCHLVIFKVIWCPTLKRKNNSTSNEFLINLRFFVTFPLGSDFLIWNAKKEIGGIFRRDAGQNAPLLRHKTKGKSRMMNKFQARKVLQENVCKLSRCSYRGRCNKSLGLQKPDRRDAAHPSEPYPVPEGRQKLYDPQRISHR